MEHVTGNAQPLTALPKGSPICEKCGKLEHFSINQQVGGITRAEKEDDDEVFPAQWAPIKRHNQSHKQCVPREH